MAFEKKPIFLAFSHFLLSLCRTLKNIKMKKTLIIALAGIMMFAFTQCGGSKGSKEYVETRELYQIIEKMVDDATTCDELQEAVFTLIFSGLASDDYTDEEKMTEAEEAKLEEYLEKIGQRVEKKSAQFGCDEEDD